MTLLREGLILPIPVYDNNLVWGSAIIDAAMEADVPRLPVCEISSDPVECAMTALRLEGRTDKYSFEEMEGIVNYLFSHGISEAPECISILVGGGEPFAAKTIKYGKLNRPLQNAVNSGLLDLKTALRLDCIPEPVIVKILNENFDLSYSERRIFLTMFREVIMRDSLRADQVSLLVEDALQSGDPMGVLRRKRYPDLTALEGKYGKLMERLVKGKGLEIKAPPYFEGGSYRVEFSAAGKKQLEKKISVLKEILCEWDKFEELLF